MNRPLAVTTAGIGLALLGLTACSSSTTSPTPAVSSAVAEPATASAADIAFAQSMIPHHEQAIEMADLALSPQADASPEVKQLAKQIKAAQDPEIEQMTQWLEQWGAPTAMPGTDAGGGTDMEGMDHGHDMGGMTVSGMMSAQEMAALSKARGQEFDTMWLQMMIAHHEGAIQMAQQVKAGSDNPQVVALADRIIAAQRAEIATMKQDLAG